MIRRPPGWFFDQQDYFAGLVDAKENEVVANISYISDSNVKEKFKCLGIVSW